MEQVWEGGDWEGVEDLGAVQHIIHSLVPPPPTGHCPMEKANTKFTFKPELDFQ